MKTFAAALLVPVLAGALYLGQAEDARTAYVKSKTRVAVEMLARSDFSDAWEMFDGELKRKLPPEKVREAWASMIEQAGPFVRQTDVRAGRTHDYDVVIVWCEFERGVAQVRVIYKSGEDEIGGLWVLPAGEG